MSLKIGTALTASATKVLFCGAGELGKEVVIAMQRLGVEVIAVDRYANAPGMQVAHRSYVINMLDGKELRRVIEAENRISSSPKWRRSPPRHWWNWKKRASASSPPPTPHCLP